MLRLSSRLLALALAASPIGAAVALCSSIARADVEPDAVKQVDAPFVFAGRGIYAGGGAGMLTDLGAATENWSILATFPLAGRLPDGTPRRAASSRGSPSRRRASASTSCRRSRAR